MNYGSNIHAHDYHERRCQTCAGKTKQTKPSGAGEDAWSCTVCGKHVGAAQPVSADPVLQDRARIEAEATAMAIHEVELASGRNGGTRRAEPAVLLSLLLPIIRNVPREPEPVPAEATPVTADVERYDEATDWFLAEIRALMGVQKASKARRPRRGPVAYSPPTQLPGPKATDISTARARKILREYGWR